MTSKTPGGALDSGAAAQIEHLRRQLAEAEATIESLLAREVDAVVEAEYATPILLQEAQQALRASEETFRAVFEGATDAMIIAADDGRYLRVNPAACELFGVPEEHLLGRSAADFSPPDYDSAAAWQRFQADEQIIGEFPLLRPGGEVRVAEYSAVTNFLPGRHLSILRDVTERKALEQALRESEAHRIRQERMAAVGQLTAGLAHAFNNILTGVMLRTDAVLRNPDVTRDVQASLEVVEEQSMKAARLIDKLLAFSRQALLRPARFDLASFLHRQGAPLRDRLPDTIDVRISVADAPAGTYEIEGDAGRLEDVLFNLALNAWDAMPRGGTLSFKLDQAPAQVTCIACPGPLEGAWLRLAVRDTGEGIKPELHPHLFEPFFTTRMPQRNGLGLSQVLGIVKQHGGHIAVESAPGAGTAMLIYLPPAESAQEAQPADTEG